MKKILSLLAFGAISLNPVLAQDTEPLSIAEVAAYTPDSFSTLTAALVTTDLAQTLNGNGQFTVFAPTNAAFDAAAKLLLEDPMATGPDLLLALDKETLADVLLYHVVPGKLLSGDVLAADTFMTANGADIMRDGTTILGGQGSMGGLVLDLIDIEAANGIVHVIDGVLLPPTGMEPVSIYETAASNPAFSTLVKAIDKTGLKWLLSYERFNLTVFAPVNAAFDETAKVALNDDSATGEELVEALDRWTLRKILLNHVIWGELFSEDVLARDSYRTFSRGNTITRDGTTLMSKNGEADLVLDLIDIDATNGVVHVIDGVLLP